MMRGGIAQHQHHSAPLLRHGILAGGNPCKAAHASAHEHTRIHIMSAGVEKVHTCDGVHTCDSVYACGCVEVDVCCVS